MLPEAVLMLFAGDEWCCLLLWGLVLFAVVCQRTVRGAVLAMVFSKRNVLLADMLLDDVHRGYVMLLAMERSTVQGNFVVLYLDNAISYLQTCYLMLTEAVLMLFAGEEWCCLPRSDAVCRGAVLFSEERCCLLLYKEKIVVLYFDNGVL